MNPGSRSKWCDGVTERNCLVCLPTSNLLINNNRNSIDNSRENQLMEWQCHLSPSTKSRLRSIVWTSCNCHFIAIEPHILAAATVWQNVNSVSCSILLVQQRHRTFGRSRAKLRWHRSHCFRVGHVSIRQTQCRVFERCFRSPPCCTSAWKKKHQWRETWTFNFTSPLCSGCRFCQWWLFSEAANVRLKHDKGWAPSHQKMLPQTDCRPQNLHFWYQGGQCPPAYAWLTPQVWSSTQLIGFSSGSDATLGQVSVSTPDKLGHLVLFCFVTNSTGDANLHNAVCINERIDPRVDVQKYHSKEKSVISQPLVGFDGNKISTICEAKQL